MIDVFIAIALWCQTSGHVGLQEQCRTEMKKCLMKYSMRSLSNDKCFDEKYLKSFKPKDEVNK